MIGVYAVVNGITGDLYVGQSANLERRFNEHRRPCKAHTLIGQAIQTYGNENFIYIVLEECEKTELFDKEEKWIELLNPKYNRSKGRGSKGCKMPEERKKAISDNSKRWWQEMTDDYRAEYLERLSNSLKGRPVSEETRNKIGYKNKGRIPSEETRKKMSEAQKKAIARGKITYKNFQKVRCIETGEIFNSVIEASEKTGASRYGISAVTHGKQKTTHGYTFENL